MKNFLWLGSCIILLISISLIEPKFISLDKILDKIKILYKNNELNGDNKASKSNNKVEKNADAQQSQKEKAYSKSIYSKVNENYIKIENLHRNSIEEKTNFIPPLLSIYNSTILNDKNIFTDYAKSEEYRTIKHLSKYVASIFSKNYYSANNLNKISVDYNNTTSNVKKPTNLESSSNIFLVDLISPDFNLHKNNSQSSSINISIILNQTQNSNSSISDNSTEGLVVKFINNSLIVYYDMYFFTPFINCTYASQIVNKKMKNQLNNEYKYVDIVGYKNNSKNEISFIQRLELPSEIIKTENNLDQTNSLKYFYTDHCIESKNSSNRLKNATKISELINLTDSYDSIKTLYHNNLYYKSKQNFTLTQNQLSKLGVANLSSLTINQQEDIKKLAYDELSKLSNKVKKVFNLNNNNQNLDKKIINEYLDLISKELNNSLTYSFVHDDVCESLNKINILEIIKSSITKMFDKLEEIIKEKNVKSELLNTLTLFVNSLNIISSEIKTVSYHIELMNKLKCNKLTISKMNLLKDDTSKKSSMLVEIIRNIMRKQNFNFSLLIVN